MFGAANLILCFLDRKSIKKKLSEKGDVPGKWELLPVCSKCKPDDGPRNQEPVRIDLCSECGTMTKNVFIGRKMYQYPRRSLDAFNILSYGTNYSHTEWK